MIFVQDESETPKALYAIRAEASGAVSPSMVQKALKARVGILRAFILPYEKKPKRVVSPYSYIRYLRAASALII